MSYGDISHIGLQTAHVAQLKQLGQSLSGVDHGSVISKQACSDLIEKRLACKDSKCYYATNQGLHWLRCAEIECAPLAAAKESQ